MARVFVALVLVERVFGLSFILSRFSFLFATMVLFVGSMLENGEFHQIIFQMKCFVGNNNASVCLVFIIIDGVYWLDFPVGVILEMKCKKIGEALREALIYPDKKSIRMHEAVMLMLLFARKLSRIKFRHSMVLTSVATLSMLKFLMLVFQRTSAWFCLR